jgi:hypothetical protein
VTNETRYDQGYYSHEGGQSGNLFAGHYFDMNAKHIEGEQYPMVLSRGQLTYSKSESLTIKPLVEDKFKPSKDQTK